MKLNKRDKANITGMYHDKVPVSKIAKKYKVARSSIYDYLNKHNITTTREPHKVKCNCCQKTIQRPPSSIKRNLNNFCDEFCHQAFFEAGASHLTKNKTGTRLARNKVSTIFNLQPEHVVAHKDKDKYNNQIWNLIVFSSLSSCILYRHYHLKQDIKGLNKAIQNSNIKIIFNQNI